MKKTIIKAILSITSFMTMSPLSGAVSGVEIASTVKEDYSKGFYDKFLSELQSEYERAGKGGILRGLFQSMKKAHPGLTNTNNPELTAKRNEALARATIDSPQLSISKAIDRLALSPLHADPVFAELEALKYHLPETNKATTENKISAIETEYQIKGALLDIASNRAGTPLEEKYKKLAALQYEKLDKLESAAAEFDDKVWIDKLARARQVFDQHLAVQIDYRSLKDMALGKIEPENETEEEVKTIMQTFLVQKKQAFNEEIAQR